MHHKRKRPKNRRAGCLLCKPHKANGFKGGRTSQTLQEQRAIERDEQVEKGDVWGDESWIDYYLYSYNY